MSDARPRAGLGMDLGAGLGTGLDMAQELKPPTASPRDRPAGSSAPLRPAPDGARGPRLRLALPAPPASTARLVGLGLLLGAAMGAGHVPFAAWWLALPALALAFALSLSLGPRRAALLGLAIGAGHFGLALHWIVEPFLVDVARHGWMAPFAVVGLSLLLAGYWAAAWAAAAWLSPRPVPRALALALALSAVEMIRARAFTGFAWASPAYLWSETPVYQALSWAGPHGLALLTALMAAGLGLAMARALPAWTALGPLVLGAGLALWGGAREIPGPAPGAPVIRLVQPNAAQHLKWDPAWSAEFLRRAIEASGALPGPDGLPALVVWPEASVPYLLEGAGPVFQAVAAATGGAPAAIGIQRREGGSLYNSLVVTSPSGETASIYDKHHLVPFGEFMPLGALASRAGLRGLAARDGSGYAAGPGPRVLDIPGIGPALPLICYEAVFPRDTRTETRPRLMLHVTNDAWFGTFAGPVQHLAQSRARAIEQGLPLLRAANTGISAAIDAGGRVQGQLPLGVSGHLDAALPAALAPPLYARMGDAPLGAGLGLILGAWALARMRRRP